MGTGWGWGQRRGHFSFCLFQKCAVPSLCQVPPRAYTLLALPADTVFSEIDRLQFLKPLMLLKINEIFEFYIIYPGLF